MIAQANRRFTIGVVESISRLDQPRLAVPLLLLIALVLRLPNLNESLWLDEVLYSTHYRIADVSRLWQYILRTPAAPLYPILTFVWVSVVGDHYELLVRLPSLLCGLGSIVLTYHLARRFGSGYMPLLAGLILCVSPAHVWYSQEATPYAMTTFLLLATVLAWSRLTRPPFGEMRYAVYLALLLATVFTHYYAVVFPLPLTLLSAATAKPLRRRILLAHGVVALCFVLALGTKYVSGRLVSGMGFLRPFTIFEWWMLFFNWFLHGNSLWTISPYRASLGDLLGQRLLLGLQMVCALILVCGLLPSREKKGAVAAWELALYLCTLPVVMLLLTMAGHRELYIERYLLVVIPFFVIALARGATRFPLARMRSAVAFGLVAIGVASYAMLLHKSTLWTVYKQNPDWRHAAQYVLAQRLFPSEVLVLAVTPPSDFVYYLRKQMPERAPEVRMYSAAAVDHSLATGRIRTVVLVKNLSWLGQFDEVLEQFEQDHRFHLATRQSFKAVELYLFVPSVARTGITLKPDEGGH